MPKRRMPPGHGWAYLGVVLGLGASIAGNVANTVLTHSDVPLQLRVPFAVGWPIFMGIGIEVLTRVHWERNWRHWFARVLLMGPMTLVAAFMSYLHLHHLMILSGEPGLAQAVGPVAIDGTLFGCTVALLVTRHAARGADAGPRKSLAERVSAARENVLTVKDAALGKPAEPAAPVAPIVETPVAVPALRDYQREAAAVMTGQFATPPDAVDVELEKLLEEARPVSPPKPLRTYTPRGQWDIQKAVELVAEGELGDQAIADLVHTSFKSIQRVRRGYKLLRDNPRATVPADWKVPAAVLDVIRREVSR